MKCVENMRGNLSYAWVPFPVVAKQRKSSEAADSSLQLGLCDKYDSIFRQQKSTCNKCKCLSSPYGNRTRVSAVRGRRLNRLTNEPSIILS